jgi:hypothetical protein
MIIRIIAFINAAREIIRDTRKLRAEMRRKHGPIAE